VGDTTNNNNPMGAVMISKDESIVTQVAAKIASDLTNTTAIAERTADAIQALYLSHFDFVVDLMKSTHGWDTNNNNVVTAPVMSVSNGNNTEANAVAMIQQAFPTASEQTGIQVKGTQHGPLPAWLGNACRKAGVTAVFDNRDTANAENRRPLFKAADGTTDKNGKPVAFWAPK
jgi:hypothetical protein